MTIPNSILVLSFCVCGAAAAADLSIDTLNSLGHQAYHDGRFDEAETVYLKALDAARGNARLSGIVANNLGSLYSSEGRLREAESMYGRALTELARSGDRAAQALALDNMAVLQNKQGRFAEAEAHVSEAITLFRTAGFTQDARFAASLEILAEVHRAKRDFEGSERLLKQALDIRSKVQGAEGAAAGITMNNLAALYSSQHQFRDAEIWARRAVTLLEKAAPDQPALAAALNGLAQVLRLQYDAVDVLPLYLRALSIESATVGEQHPDYARILGNLADYELSRGQTTEGVRQYERSVAILAAALGEEQAEVLSQRAKLDRARLRAHQRPQTPVSAAAALPARSGNRAEFGLFETGAPKQSMKTW